MLPNLFWKHPSQSPFVLGVVQDIFHCTVLGFGSTKDVPVLHWSSSLLDVDMKGPDWAILPEFVVNTEAEVVQVTLFVLLKHKRPMSFVNCKMDTFSVLYISKHWLVTFISFSGVKNNDILRESTSKPKTLLFFGVSKWIFWGWLQILDVTTRKSQCLLLSKLPWLTFPATTCHLDR